MSDFKNITVLTGAGISAESGLQTFRDNNGLWNNYKVEEVATYNAWLQNKNLVLDFYNQRRKNVLEANPNEAHKALTLLASKYNVRIITQNIDDLHERAHSKQVLHLHGEILKVRSDANENILYYNWKKDLNATDVDENGKPLRPFVVWFGEEVPMIEKAIEIMYNTDIVIVVGTSLQVYPAANLLQYAPRFSSLYVVDTQIPNIHWAGNFTPIKEPASVGLPKLVDKLLAAI